MQAMRDERKGLRQHLKEKLGVPEEELNRIAPTLDAPYFGSGMPPNVDYEHDPTTTNLYVCNLPPDVCLNYFWIYLLFFSVNLKIYLKHLALLGK